MIRTDEGIRFPVEFGAELVDAGNTLPCFLELRFEIVGETGLKAWSNPFDLSLLERA